MLAAVLDPFDRAAEQAGGERHHDLLGIDQIFCAEAATDIRRDDPQLLVVEAEQLHQRHADLMRALGRGPHRGPPLPRIVAGKHATAFHRMGAAAVLEQRQREPVGSGRERTLAVAVGNRVFRQDVARHPPVHRRRVGCNRGAHVRHRRQRLELDLDALRRVLGDRAALRNHYRDRIADIADLVAHQHEWGDVLPEAAAGEPGDLPHRLAERCSLRAQVGHQIVERENRMHAGYRACRPRVDAIDGRMSMRRAHKRRR